MSAGWKMLALNGSVYGSHSRAVECEGSGPAPEHATRRTRSRCEQTESDLCLPGESQCMLGTLAQLPQFMLG